MQGQKEATTYKKTKRGDVIRFLIMEPKRYRNRFTVKSHTIWEFNNLLTTNIWQH